MTEILLTDDRHDADAEIRQRLEGLDRTAREAHRALHVAARERIAEPLQQLIDETAAAHREALETYEFDRPEDAPIRPPDGLWEALTAYRRAMTVVHAHFREQLRQLDLGAHLGSLVEEALDTIAEEAARAPDEIVRAEPEGLIEPEAGDSIGLVSRKLAERARRRTAAAGRAVGNGFRRLSRSEPIAPPEHVQSVPLRALFEEQAGLVLTRPFAAEHRVMQRAVAETVTRVEAALTGWADGLLRVEPLLDRPQFHAPKLFSVERPPEAVPAETQQQPEPEPESESGASPEPNEKVVAERTEHVRRVRTLTQSLDATLHDLRAALPQPDTDALDVAQDVLTERVRRSGWDSDRIAQPGDGEPKAELTASIARWTDWHLSVTRRLRVDGLLLDLRAQLLSEVERLIERVTDATVRPLQRTADETVSALDALRAEAIEACEQSDPDALAASIQDILDRALELVDRTLLPRLQSLSLDRAIERAVRSMRERLQQAVAALPERVTLHARLGPEAIGERGPAAEVSLRRIVESTLNEEFTALIVQSADVLRQPLFNAISGAEAVRDVIRFNLEAAIEELEAAAAEAEADALDNSRPGDAGDVPAETVPDEDTEVDALETDDADEEENVFANVRELTVDGLARAEELLHNAHAPLADPWRAFVRTATETFERGWKTLHGRANAANLVEAQFLDFKKRTQYAVLQARKSAERTGQRALHLLRRTFRFGRAGAKRLVRMGQAAAGLAAQTEADRQRTIDALAEAGTLHAGLPLVYRRLFAFAPLTDPTLLEGREAALARVTSLAERWRLDLDSSSLVITAEPGGGRTSFINAVRAALADDEPTYLYFSERLNDEQTVAGHIGRAMDMDDIESFDALEDRLLDKRTRKHVCILEGLEHLILRAPEGLDLIERLLISMSRTDGTVFWIGTMGLPGWRFIERVAPQLTGLATSVPLAPFTRDQVEAALMKRHMRSGLPLVFAEPEEPSTLLARKLGKAPSAEARQTILRTEFFDGLYRASGPNLRLALLYWLRAADFESTADTLTLRPVRPLDFAFVGSFDLARSFALKALLQHGSLTLAEHDRIFRTDRDESLLIFESLRNLRLIQSVPDPDAPARRNRTPHATEDLIRDGVRYCLHPLAVAPITNALRAKNML